MGRTIALVAIDKTSREFNAYILILNEEPTSITNPSSSELKCKEDLQRRVTNWSFLTVNFNGE